MGIFNNLLKPILDNFAIYLLLKTIDLTRQFPRTSIKFVAPYISLRKDTFSTKKNLENTTAITLLNDITMHHYMVQYHYSTKPSESRLSKHFRKL